MRRSPSSSGPWSRVQRADFALRVAGLAARRLIGWALEPRAYPDPVRAAADAAPHAIASVLIPRHATSFGRRLEQGRWHNLGLAATALDGIGITPGHPFSFWRTVGRLTEARGFTEGAHFEGGCIVPAVGGGICALSDALFELALRSHCTILERHAHTLAVDRGPDAPARQRVDATVKWPYVDLRFAPRRGQLRLSTVRAADGLVLQIHGSVPIDAAEVRVANAEVREEDGQRVLHTTLVRRSPAHASDPVVLARDRKRLIATPTRNCHSCQETDCGRHRGRD